MVGPYPAHDFCTVEPGGDSRREAVLLCNFSGAWHNVEMYRLSRLTEPREVDAFGTQQRVKKSLCNTKTFRKICIGCDREVAKPGDRREGFEDQITWQAEAMRLAQFIEVGSIYFEFIHVVDV